MDDAPRCPRRVALAHSRVQSCHRSRSSCHDSASRASAAPRGRASCMLIFSATRDSGAAGG
eukprot:9556726-Alexandrium_andersonii.AAC.1